MLFWVDAHALTRCEENAFQAICRLELHAGESENESRQSTGEETAGHKFKTVLAADRHGQKLIEQSLRRRLAPDECALHFEEVCAFFQHGRKMSIRHQRRGRSECTMRSPAHAESYISVPNLKKNPIPCLANYQHFP